MSAGAICVIGIYIMAGAALFGYLLVSGQNDAVKIPMTILLIAAIFWPISLAVGVGGAIAKEMAE